MVQGRSTAVCVVMDASGSMTTRKMSVARDSMRVLLEALGDLKIATEAFTFTTGHTFDLNQAAQLCSQEPAQLRERFGKAGCEARGDAAHVHAQGASQKITRAGIELVGVGIMDGSLCEIIEDSIVVHELKDLPAQLCKLLGRTLKKGMCHVG